MSNDGEVSGRRRVVTAPIVFTLTEGSSLMMKRHRPGDTDIWRPGDQFIVVGTVDKLGRIAVKRSFGFGWIDFDEMLKHSIVKE